MFSPQKSGEIAANDVIIRKPTQARICESRVQLARQIKAGLPIASYHGK